MTGMKKIKGVLERAEIAMVWANKMDDERAPIKAKNTVVDRSKKGRFKRMKKNL